MSRTALLLLSATAALTGCASAPRVESGPMPADKQVLLILVGGNSESLGSGGIMKVYDGRNGFTSSYLATMFRKQVKLDPQKVLPVYFRWTGDDENHAGFLPGHWSWVTGGDERITESLRNLLQSRSATHQTVILGWSNGGATAYDLSCSLNQQRPVDLLITLDPVSWTTQSCPGAVAKRWVNVFTASGPLDRFKFGNIIALLGRAWDNDHLPSRPDSMKRLTPANHSETQRMLTEIVVEDPVFKEWGSQIGK